MQHQQDMRIHLKVVYLETVGGFIGTPSIFSTVTSQGGGGGGGFKTGTPKQLGAPGGSGGGAGVFMDLQLVMEAEIKILLIRMYQTRGILEDMEIILDLRMKTMAVAAVVVPVVLEEMVRIHQLEELVVMERQV